MTGALVLAETRHGAIRPVTGELVAAARSLFEEVRVLVVGQDAEALAATLDVGPVAEVVAVPGPVRHFDPDVTRAAVQAVVAEVGPRAVLLGHTIDGLGVGPALAAVSGHGFASDVARLARDGDDLVAFRGVYGGKLEAELRFPGHVTTVLMLRPGAYVPADGASGAPLRVIDVAVAPRVGHLGFEVCEGDGVDITTAELLVGIGRGVEDAADVPRMAQLAERLGGVLVGSRPLVDSGWLPASRQVGQSGRSVKPKVYLALGISGAVQHLAGLAGAETIIAVNTDPDAPIFSVADYGVVGDLFVVADALAQRLP
ncbi:MAG TPA: electron transfer flavoprotein subunit alpha/FixB family protein [Baekduia sp.]|nr:electron transfer flavoprotein subunit alpha/FixB family protein [Baekduia sp.]